jgi:hypothetical protein
VGGGGEWRRRSLTDSKGGEPGNKAGINLFAAISLRMHKLIDDYCSITVNSRSV